MKIRTLVALISAAVAAQTINSVRSPLQLSGGIMSHSATDGNCHIPKSYGVTNGWQLTTHGGSCDAYWAPPGGAAIDSARASHIADTAKVAGLSDSAKALIQYARTTAVHDTADILRTYSRDRIHDSLAVLTPGRIGAEPSITAGTTAQYWRGDKTWATFPTTWAWGSITGTPTTLSGYGITDAYSSTTSRAANTFLAAPNGSAGAATFRSIVAADVPTLNQNTTGTAANITATSNSTLTTLSALSLPIGQVTGTINATQINGGTVPASAPLLGTNSSSQPVSVTTIPTSTFPALTGVVTTTAGSVATSFAANPTFSGVVTLVGAGGGTPATLTNLGYQTYGTINGFFQNNIQNLSTGANASSDWIATANNGTDATHYVDFGINGSGYSVGTWTINGADDGYLYSQSDNLAVGTATAGKNLVLFTGGTLAANARLTLADALATFSGDVSVAGNLKLMAGTASKAPLTLQTGTNLTTATAGSVEWNGTNLFVTSGTTRNTVAWTSSNITGSAATLTTGRTIGMTGDVVWTSPSFNGSANVTASSTIQPAAVTLAKMANLAANSIIGNNTGSAATPVALTAAQTKTLLAITASDVSGIAGTYLPLSAGSGNPLSGGLYGTSATFSGAIVSGQSVAASSGGGGSAGVLRAQANTGGAALAWYTNDGATDGKWWDALALGSTLSFRAVNDANTVASTWLQVTRSGTTISSVAIPPLSAGGFVRAASSTGALSASAIAVSDLPASIQTAQSISPSRIAYGNGSSGLQSDAYFTYNSVGQMLVGTSSVQAQLGASGSGNTAWYGVYGNYNANWAMCAGFHSMTGTSSNFVIGDQFGVHSVDGSTVLAEFTKASGNRIQGDLSINNLAGTVNNAKFTDGGFAEINLPVKLGTTAISTSTYTLGSGTQSKITASYAGTVTVSLPAPSSTYAGAVYWFTSTNSSGRWTFTASGSTIQYRAGTNGSWTLATGAPPTYAAPVGAFVIRLICDGTYWWVAVE